ncbi:PucR family transcriptional regulator [Bacillus sp. 1P06AnD]|uniref:PucR family transcriptional regulator n=1 Tax=Bacillus sp. 1P06AnD TaxID=3132208 RepID=UPI0039A22EC9
MENQHSIFKGVHGDLTEFVDRISMVLNCPVTLEDAHHQLLAYSVHNKDSDPIRISTIISRRVPEKVINGLWKQGIMPSLIKESTPIIVPPIHELGLGSRAAVSVRKNQEVLGFIWALETDKAFTPEDLSFLQFAAKEAKNQLLQLQSKKKRHMESKQEFLWQLLTGHFDSEDEIASVCEQQAISLPAHFSIVVFTFPMDIGQEAERSIAYSLGTIQNIKTVLYTIDQRNLIILAGPCAASGDFDVALTSFITSFTVKMNSRFGVTLLNGACGQIYESYIHARGSYQEALYTRAIQIAFPERKEQLTNYASLGVYQYLSAMSEQRSRNNRSIRLDRLAEYDQKNNSALVQTLELYLNHDGDSHQIANELHLHVNTIHYRLKRISEIAYIDLKDPIEKMSIHIEFLLKQYECSLSQSKQGYSIPNIKQSLIRKKP